MQFDGVWLTPRTNQHQQRPYPTPSPSIRASQHHVRSPPTPARKRAPFPPDIIYIHGTSSEDEDDRANVSVRNKSSSNTTPRTRTSRRKPRAAVPSRVVSASDSEPELNTPLALFYPRGRLRPHSLSLSPQLGQAPISTPRTLRKPPPTPHTRSRKRAASVLSLTDSSNPNFSSDTDTDARSLGVATVVPAPRRKESGVFTPSKSWNDVEDILFREADMLLEQEREEEMIDFDPVYEIPLKCPTMGPDDLAVFMSRIALPEPIHSTHARLHLLSPTSLVASSECIQWFATSERADRDAMEVARLKNNYKGVNEAIMAARSCEPVGASRPKKKAGVGKGKAKVTPPTPVRPRKKVRAPDVGKASGSGLHQA